MRKLSILDHAAEVEAEVIKNSQSLLIPWIPVPGIPFSVQRLFPSKPVFLNINMSGSFELLIQVIWLIKVQFDKQVERPLVDHLAANEGYLYQAFYNHNGVI